MATDSLTERLEFFRRLQQLLTSSCRGTQLFKGQYLGWSVPMDDDGQGVIQHVPGSYPTIFKFEDHLIWKKST